MRMEYDKMQIKLSMEQRKNEESANYIRKLKALFRMEKDKNKERKSRITCLNEGRREFFELSPDKYDDNL